MPSYTLSNWDGSLSNPQDQISSRRQEKQPSSSATNHSRVTPSTPQKSLANGNITGNKDGYQAGGVESSGLTDPLNGVQISQEPGYSIFWSTQETGSPASAVQTTPRPNGHLNTSDLQQTTFIPIMESPLHANKTRLNASTMGPGSLPFYPSPTRHNPPQFPHENSNEIDAISIHTVDAEGEDEHDDLIIVEDLLIPCSPQKSRYSLPQARTPSVTRSTWSSSSSPPAAFDSPLFTPPSSDYTPVDRLFTPEPAIRKNTQPLKMSHVEVPLLLRPKSDYIIFSKKHRKKALPLSSQAHLQVHKSLSDAMQAAYSINEDLGTLPSRIVPKKKKPKERREEDLNAVAGPSTLLPPSVVKTNKKRSRPHKDEDDYEGGGKVQKRSHTLIDLVLSDDERAHRNDKRPPFARTRYESQTDSLRLYLSIIHPVPIPVLAYNIRFIRKFQAKHGILAPDGVKVIEKASYRYFIPPKPSVQVNEEVIMSIGDPVAWEEDFCSPVDEGLDDKVVFVEGVSRDVIPPAEISSMHIPRPPPPPPKIDLVAEMRKKQNRKTQGKCVSSANQKQTHHDQSHCYVATSLSSSTGLYPENHTSSWNESQPQHENVTSPMPSAKALGKRKATNLDSSEDLILANHVPIHPNGAPPILVNRPQGLAYNLDLFLHPFARSPSPGFAPTSSTHVSYSNLQSSSSFYPSTSTTESGNHPIVDNSALPHLYLPEMLVENVENSQETFLSETVLDGLDTQSKPSDLWSALEDEINGQYEFSTIDPTLLGGHPMNQDSPKPEPELEHDPLSLAIQFPSALNSEPSSSTSHNSPDPSENEYEPSIVTMDFSPRATNPTASRASSAPSALTSPRGVRRRRQSQRNLHDMVPIDDLDISGSSSSSSGYESSSSDVRSESSVVTVSSRPRVVTTSPTKPDLPKVSNLPSQHSLHAQQVWPLEASESCCHQCRNKNRILKMHCSCGKLFCARCLTIRYPGKFDYTMKQQYNCPYCEDFCNCTVCCRKRGETYVSSGRGGWRKKTTRQPLSIRKRVSLGGKTNLPPLSQRPSEPVKYWGAVYSLTGEKIASTFAPQTEEGHPAVVFGLPNSEKSVVITQRKPRPHKREFVGKVQRHWGYSKHRKIKELKDKAHFHPKAASKRKRYEGEIRWYVGHGARLFWPQKESMEYSLLDDLSPLSSLEDDNDEPDEPEPPPSQEKACRSGSLGEDVVGHVIALALEACGTDSKVYPALV